MATYTTNLNLKKPATTDTALIGDINDNMDTIDSAVAGKAPKTEAIKNITRSGTTFTATRCDGTTFTFTQQDNDHYAWSDITGKPSYYDATAIKNITRSGTTFTATRMNGTTFTFTQQDNDHYAWSDITGKPVFSGGSTTLAWGTQKTVAVVGGNNVNVTLPANPNTWRGIQNNLTSTSTTDSLSAYQGKILNDGTVKRAVTTWGTSCQLATQNSAGHFWVFCNERSFFVWVASDGIHVTNNGNTHEFNASTVTMNGFTFTKSAINKLTVSTSSNASITIIS